MAPNTTREGACAPRNEAVALVITLLMLSVITFLTIAFLEMSQRNKTAVSTSLDAANARAASDAALARARTEIIAQMMAHNDALYYDWMVSSAYTSPYNFLKGAGYQATNVNYDSFFTNSPGTYSGSDYAQMMANLWYDPRVPVFVVTNQAYPASNDFRFWVDINRNGKFETNGYQPMVDDNGKYTGSYGFLNGEPQWIGILKNPLYAHSSSNQFIGRYAYLVLPIGKQLDLNYMHNDLKIYQGNVDALYNSNTVGATEGFARDQGLGSWELNGAALLDNVSPWAYENPTNPFGYSPYKYVPPNSSLNDSGLGNTGNAFYDAEALLHYRYGAPNYSLTPLNQIFPTNVLDFENNLFDMYCSGSTVTNYSRASYPRQYFNQPWPGSYQSNQFFDVQDLFDPVKTSAFFTNRMIQASLRTNTFDRYTFQRLLSSAGMGSSPEYGTWVYGDNDGLGNPTQLRTKVNINYDNTIQITNAKAPYAPMPSYLVPWTPIGFFTNAAELLLRSQTFMFPNYVLASNGTITYLSPPALPTHFGVTNIPIYRANLPGIRYNASIHRMLQLAANIYDATVSNSYPAGQTIGKVSIPNVRHPSIFRPLFAATNVGTTNVGINIVGYVQVPNAETAFTQMSHLPFYDLAPALATLISTGNSNINISGIPWIVAANQGLPQFYQYSYNSSVLVERKVQLVRHGTLSAPITNQPPLYTNQFFCMAITNNFGMDGFNPYSNYFTGSTAAGSQTSIYISNYITVQVTNNYNFGFTVPITNFTSPLQFAYQNWSPWTTFNSTNGFKTFFTNNVVSTLLSSYYSELNGGQFWTLNNGFLSQSNQFRSADSAQKGWPVHNWTVNVTNHVVYALFDGIPGAQGSALLDFVNLGPFSTNISITNAIWSGGNSSKPGGSGLGGAASAANSKQYWNTLNANDFSSSPMSVGLQNQVWNPNVTNYSLATNYQNALNGLPNSYGGLIFGPPVTPAVLIQQSNTLVANDPMVHYTLDDLTFPQTDQLNVSDLTPAESQQIAQPTVVTNTILIGTINSSRYSAWGSSDTTGNNMLFKDPLISGATNWSFPTNRFPGVGWLGRVHRGTPWQTVYLKADNPLGTSTGLALGQSWTNWSTSPWLWPNWPAAWEPGDPLPTTYPTNDWALVDLFTTATDDNSARGLLSVNQTNEAAWAAIFSGVIAPTNSTGGIQIMPNNSGLIAQNFTNFVDGPSGINGQRPYFANLIFHKVGDILSATNLTTTSPLLVGGAANYPDEIVERIPQQTLSLLKVGEPQFVIFAWGQSVKPKGPPFLSPGNVNNNIYTNYEITGETLTRTVCHIVHTNGLKMVVDSFNVETGSGN